MGTRRGEALQTPGEVEACGVWAALKHTLSPPGRMNPFADSLRRLQEAFRSGRTRSAEFWAAQLKGLGRFLRENKQLLQDSLAQDLHKSALESDVSELIVCQNEVDLAFKNLHSWMKDEPVSTNMFRKLSSAFVRKEPFGLVLIISTWNHPGQLTRVPQVGAVAAGNCVVLKPSEISRTVEKVLAKVLPPNLDHSCFAVVLGGPEEEETGQLLENRFDYIFFTRSPGVGKSIMAAVAKHLTPVTLELGGKNPCYVDDDCDPQTVASCVVWFRCFNTGQTCVAPDYVLCSRETQERLLPAMQSAITRFYGKDPKSSPDLGRIIGEKQFRRLQALLGCGHVAIGGQSDESERYIAPTVLVDVQETEPVMQEEIFGPILPIVNVKGLDEAVDFITRREKPLALYAFSSNSQMVNQMLERTSSGSFRGNEGFVYLTLPSLPLRGVGHSGMGRYHGKFSFDAFSRHRACLLSNAGLEKLNEVHYPLYSTWRQQFITWALGSQSYTPFCDCPPASSTLPLHDSSILLLVAAWP
ncbi:LOW QUALITY PROTEIN: aldehyde dehydrogenase family 3 member B2-like [Dugong dugon]